VADLDAIITEWTRTRTNHEAMAQVGGAGNFKRMTMIDTLFGDADGHLATLARLGGLFGKTQALSLRAEGEASSR
jgi:hypothetical protein